MKEGRNRKLERKGERTQREGSGGKEERKEGRKKGHPTGGKEGKNISKSVGIKSVVCPVYR